MGPTARAIVASLPPGLARRGRLPVAQHPALNEKTPERPGREGTCFSDSHGRGEWENLWIYEECSSTPGTLSHKIKSYKEFRAGGSELFVPVAVCL